MKSKLILNNMEMGYNGRIQFSDEKVEQMKSMKMMMGAGLALLTFGSLHAAADCGLGFMKDPCAREGYSVVESERFVPGPHNCMAIAHYFPGEEPEGYCGGTKGKNTARAHSPVASVRD